MVARATAFLTNRETVVLCRLARPGTKADIAREMFLSINTIKSHVAHVYAKLGVRNRREAVLRARELGIVVLTPEDRALERDDDSGFVLDAGEAMQYLVDLARVYAKRDSKLFERIHTGDVRWVSAVATCSGIDAMRERVLELAGAVPDVRAELVDLTIDADRNQAIYEYTVSGTHLGPLCVGGRWYPATGKPFRYTSMAVVTFDEIGLVAEVRSYFDFIDIVRQVGLAAG
jgi:DNA-binding CsgD family transcriptional regulator/predicted ester cyclase